MKITSVIDEVQNFTMKNIDFIKNHMDKLSIMRANVENTMIMENCLFKNNTVLLYRHYEFTALFTTQGSGFFRMSNITVS